MTARGTHKSWLASCPANDGNFKVHLKQASDEEIKELIDELPEKGNKSKIAVLQTELRKRNKASRDRALAAIRIQAECERLRHAPFEEVVENMRGILKSKD